MAQRICVTGASGQAGRAVVTDLRKHGYQVQPTDVAVGPGYRDVGRLHLVAVLAQVGHHRAARLAARSRHADPLCHRRPFPCSR